MSSRGRAWPMRRLVPPPPHPLWRYSSTGGGAGGHRSAGARRNQEHDRQRALLQVQELISHLVEGLAMATATLQTAATATRTARWMRCQSCARRQVKYFTTWATRQHMHSDSMCARVCSSGQRGLSPRHARRPLPTGELAAAAATACARVPASARRGHCASRGGARQPRRPMRCAHARVPAAPRKREPSSRACAPRLAVRLKPS